MKYLHTNDDLSNIMCPKGGAIQWHLFGFTIGRVSRAVSEKMQQTDENGKCVSLLPIDDEEVFNTSLGNLVSDTPNKDGIFYRVISEESAIAERDRLIAYNKAQAEITAANAPFTIDQKLDLLMMAQLESEGII